MTQVMTPTDVALVTRLQRRVKELEQEKARMRHDLDLDETERGPSGDPEREMYDAIKVRLRPMITILCVTLFLGMFLNINCFA